MATDSRRPEFKYIHVPKNGGTAYLDWLCKKAPDVATATHATAEEVLQESPDAVLVSLYRNPWDRIVSWYGYALGDRARVSVRPKVDFEHWLFEEATDFQKLPQEHWLSGARATDLLLPWDLLRFNRGLGGETPANFFRLALTGLGWPEHELPKGSPRDLNNSRRNIDYRGLFSERTRCWVGKNERWVVDSFGYRFEDAAKYPMEVER